MTLPTPIPDRLAKLLALIDSDHDQEALAAARAIQRVLKTAAPDLHAPAALLDVVRIAGKPCRIGRGLRARIREMAKESGQ